MTSLVVVPTFDLSQYYTVLRHIILSQRQQIAISFLDFFFQQRMHSTVHATLSPALQVVWTIQQQVGYRQQLRHTAWSVCVDNQQNLPSR